MSARRRPRIPAGVWEARKETMRRLYLDESKTLEGEDGIMGVMARDYSFLPAQYETKLKNWGFRKYASKKDWLTLFQILDNEQADGGTIVVYLYGDKVPQKKLDKKRATYRNDNIVGLTSASSPLLPLCFRIERQLSTGAELLPTRATAKVEDTIISPLLSNLPGRNVNCSPSIRGAVTTAIDSEVNITNLLHAYPSPIPPLSGNSPSPHPTTMNISRLDNWSPVQSWFTNFLPETEDSQMRHLGSAVFTESVTPFLWNGPGSLLAIFRDSRLVIPNHLVSVFEQAFEWVKAPIHILLPSDTRDILSTRAPSAQVFYFVVHAFINKLVKYERLLDPEDDTGELFRRVIQYFNSLSADRLGSILDQFPDPARKVLEEAIFIASVELGANRAMESLLDLGLNPDLIIFEDRRTALDHTIYHNHVDAFFALIQRGHTILSKPGDRLTTWHSKLHPEIIKFLIQKSSQYLKHWKHHVLWLNDPSLLLFCIEHSLNHGKTKYMFDFLVPYMAVGENHEVSRMVHSRLVPLIQDPEMHEFLRHTSDSFFEDCLAVFVYKKNYEVVELLLKYGVLPDSACLCVAIRSGDTNVVKKLLDTGVSPILRGRVSDRMKNLGICGYIDEPIPIVEALHTHRVKIKDVFKNRGYFKELLGNPDIFYNCLRRAVETGNVAVVNDLMDCSLYDGTPVTSGGRSFSFSLDAFYSNPKQQQDAIRTSLGKHIAYSETLLSVSLLERDFETASHMTDVCWGQMYSSGPLHAAVLSGNIAMVQTLIDANFPQGPWARIPQMVISKYGSGCNEWDSLLTTAIFSRNEAMIDFLIENSHFNLIPQPHSTSVSPMLAALQVGDSASTRKLLEKGFTPCFEDRFTEESWKLQLYLIYLILDAGLKFPTTIRVDWETPVLIAVLQREGITTLNQILNRGSETSRHQDSNIPLDLRPSVPRKINKISLGEGLVYAIVNCKSNINICLDQMQSLLNCGADPNLVTEHTFQTYSNPPLRLSVLAIASGTGDLSKVRTLVEAGADIHLPARRGITSTAMQQAASIGALHIVKYLLELGARTGEAPAYHNGRTALQLAAEGGYVGIISLLMEHGASPNESRCPLEGRTAFEAAAENGRIDTLYFLAEHGVDLASDGGEQRKNAIWLAEKNYHGVTVDVLEALYMQACQKQAASRTEILETGDPFATFTEDNMWEI